MGQMSLVVKILGTTEESENSFWPMSGLCFEKLESTKEKKTSDMERRRKTQTQRRLGHERWGFQKNC